MINLQWQRNSWSHPTQHDPFWKVTVVMYILWSNQLLFEHKFQSVQEESLHPGTGFGSQKHAQQTHQSVDKNKHEHINKDRSHVYKLRYVASWSAIHQRKKY